TPAPPPGAGESDIQAKLRAIQAKQAAQLIAVQTKYKEEVRKQDEEYDKRWNELNKSSTPPVAVKEEGSNTRASIVGQGPWKLIRRRSPVWKTLGTVHALRRLVPSPVSEERLIESCLGNERVDYPRGRGGHWLPPTQQAGKGVQESFPGVC